MSIFNRHKKNKGCLPNIEKIMYNSISQTEPICDELNDGWDIFCKNLEKKHPDYANEINNNYTEYYIKYSNGFISNRHQKMREEAQKFIDNKKK